eukprot:6537133-Prymnesium_polylepis.1
MGRYRRGSIGMNKAKKRKVPVDEHASDAGVHSDTLLMPPPPPRSPDKKQANKGGCAGIAWQEESSDAGTIAHAGREAAARGREAVGQSARSTQALW